MLLVPLIAIFMLFGIVSPATADAFELAVHDQGADQRTLHQTADALGARIVRLIAKPGEPHLEQIRAARRHGLRVQVAILAKRDTTAGDVRALLRAWDGQVRTVSIGNEPELNGLPACTYARLYRTSYAMIRREFPGVRVGFGEFSPNRAVEYSDAVMRCPGKRIRADFWAWHAYQWTSDPLAASGARQNGFWGIGDAGSVKRHLAKRATRARLSTRTGRALPIRITEFAYLTSGKYAVTAEQAAWMWPRAVAQARRHTAQLVVYGLGPVHDQSNWGSAALLDADGYGLPSLWALLRALGRSARGLERPLPASSGLLPDGEPVKAPPAPVGHGASDETSETPDEGGQTDEPAPETEPVPGGGSGDQPPLEPAPPADTLPVYPSEEVDGAGH